MAFVHVSEAWSRQVRAYARSVSLFQEVRRRQLPRVFDEQAPPTATGLAPGRAGQPAPGPTAPSHRPRRTPGSPPERPPLTVVPSVSTPPPNTSPLTPRQVEIVELIARGMTNSQIAQRLVLTPGTVANHVENILRRLHVPNRAAAAAWLAEARRTLAQGEPDDANPAALHA